MNSAGDGVTLKTLTLGRQPSKPAESNGKLLLYIAKFIMSSKGIKDMAMGAADSSSAATLPGRVLPKQRGTLDRQQVTVATKNRKPLRIGTGMYELLTILIHRWQY